MTTEATESATPETADSPALSLPDRLARMGRMIAFQSELKTFIDSERGALFGAMREQQEQTGSKAFSHQFAPKAAVTFTIKENDDRVVVSDSDAFLEWVEANHPSEVETIIQVRESFQKALIKSVIGSEAGVFDTDGNEVPGLKWVPAEAPSSFGTSWKGDGKTLALEEVMAGGVSDLLSLEAGEGK